MDVLTIDLETSIKNRGEEAVGNMKADPWHPQNNIVLYGFKKNDESSMVSNTCQLPIFFGEGIDLLVGHNIKFDLHYLMHKSACNIALEDWLLNGGRIWDTQLAEYILSGQTHLYPSLDEVALKYGGHLKDDRIKDFWNNGIDTEDIPREMLTEYLIGDLDNTYKVFLGQLVKAEQLGMLDLMVTQMEALLATTEMEFNGMFFDKALANKHAAELSSELVEIEEFVRQVMQDAGIDEPNTSSPLQIGLVLFGGVLQYDGTETLLDEAGEPLVFKTGKRKGEVRTRKVKLQRSIEGLFPSKGERTPKGSWKVDDASLKKLPKHPFVNNLMSLRTLNKDISTYYVGYSNLVWHDGRIHQSLNHCATATGRLSCTKPNLQNVTSSE